MDDQQIFQPAPGQPESDSPLAADESVTVAIRLVEEGAFSPLLVKICHNCGLPQAKQWLRAAARQVVEENGRFTLQEDPASWLLYDLQYLLYSFAFPKASFKQYLRDYPLILAEDGQFTTGGYTPAFVARWMERRVGAGELIQAGKMTGQKNCLVFTVPFMEQIVLACKDAASRYAL